MSVARHAVVALAATGLVLTGGAATAATKSAKDRAGDATQSADVTLVTVENGESVLAVKAKLTKAVAGRTHLVATMTSADAATTYVASTVALPAKGKSRAQKVGVELTSLTAGATDAVPVDCEGMKATLSSGRKGQSSIRIPQSCFGADAGTLVVDVATADSSGDVVDQVPGALRVTRG